MFWQRTLSRESRPTAKSGRSNSGWFSRISSSIRFLEGTYMVIRFRGADNCSSGHFAHLVISACARFCCSALMSISPCFGSFLGAESDGRTSPFSFNPSMWFLPFMDWNPRVREPLNGCTLLRNKSFEKWHAYIGAPFGFFRLPLPRCGMNWLESQ